MAFGHLAILIGLVLTAAPALAQGHETLRQLTDEQTAAYEAGKARPGTLSVTSWVDRSDAIYVVGERLRLFVRVNEDAYVTVINIGPSGRVTRLFPNAHHPNNRVAANETIEVPAPESGAAITVAPPLGVELIKVIATSQPIPLFAPGQLQPSGPFATAAAGVASLVRSLEMATVNPPDGDLRVAIENRLIRTVVDRAEAAAAPAQGFIAAPRPLQGFPLLIALDRPSYRIGERVAIAVTTVRPCHLTVLNVNARGGVRVIFPNQAMRENALAANQTVLISGGPGPAGIVASAPAGNEQVIAVCTSEPHPILSAPLDFAELFTALPRRDGVERDLSGLAGRPPGSVGVAVATFTIEP